MNNRPLHKNIFGLNAQQYDRPAKKLATQQNIGKLNPLVIENKKLLRCFYIIYTLIFDKRNGLHVDSDRFPCDQCTASIHRLAN